LDKDIFRQRYHHSNNCLRLELVQRVAMSIQAISSSLMMSQQLSKVIVFPRTISDFEIKTAIHGEEALAKK
jgi:hypothetical protein